MTMDVSVSVARTFDDYLNGFRLLYRKRRTLRGMLVCLLFAPAFLVGGWALVDLPFGLGMAGGWLGWLAFMLTIGQYLAIRHNTRKSWNTTPSMQAEAQYGFDAHSLWQGLDHLQPAETPWKFITAIAEDDTVMILFQGPNMIHVLPRRLIPDQDLARIAALAEAAGVRRL